LTHRGVRRAVNHGRKYERRRGDGEQHPHDQLRQLAGCAKDLRPHQWLPEPLARGHRREGRGLGQIVSASAGEPNHDVRHV
jgi:hypothetical protein